MAGPNSPNTLKSKNRLSPKDIIKRTAALTLLLSTTACTSSEFLNIAIPLFCTVGWIPTAFLGMLVLDYFGLWNNKNEDHNESRDRTIF